MASRRGGCIPRGSCQPADVTVQGFAHPGGVRGETSSRVEDGVNRLLRDGRACKARRSGGNVVGSPQGTVVAASRFAPRSQPLHLTHGQLLLL